MLEITFQYLEENFEEIMNNIELKGTGYLVILPDGDRLVLAPEKNHVIKKMEKEGLIEELK